MKKHVSQLMLSEYKRALDLLYDVLLFGAREIAPVEARRLHDHVDGRRRPQQPGHGARA